MTKTTREIEQNKNLNILFISMLISLLLCIGTVVIVYGLLHKEKPEVVEKIEVSCCSYYNCPYGHEDMICEEGVQGDINDEFGGRIWYCGDDAPKICLIKYGG